MTREEAIKLIMYERDSIDTEGYYGTKENYAAVEAFDMAIEALSGEWVLVSERLPEPNMAVLGYAPQYDNIFAVYYDSVCGWMVWSPIGDDLFPEYYGEIVAWMPMPVEPYKECKR